MNSSFYGGKQGFSFILSKAFASVDEMVAAFSQGPNYSTVSFDDYVIINTENKNDATNGNIYRRGYDYTNDMGGAIYIGSIVGPAGLAPHLELSTIDDIDKKIEETKDLENFRYRIAEGVYNEADNNIIPGKDGNTFNDDITWKSYSLRDEYYKDTIAYIGFKIPYLVEEFDAKTVNPYYNKVDNEDGTWFNDNLIELDHTISDPHAFYNKWHFSIPKGIKGDAIKNFRAIVPDLTDVIYNLDGTAYDNVVDDHESNREILVYDYYDYTNDPSGEPKTIFIGDYNMISNISFDEHGTIEISYTHDDKTTYSQLIKWVNSVSLNVEDGHFRVIFNQLDEEGTPLTYETDLTWVKDVSIDEHGTVTFDYTTIADKVYEQLIQWIKSAELDTDTGHFTITYNTVDEDGNPNTYETDLQWIKDITINENGTIDLIYTNKDNTTYQQLFTWITKTELNPDNGHFTVTYNTVDENGAPVTYENNLTWVKDISIDEHGTVTLDYTTLEDKVYNQLIKWVKDVSLNKDTGHLVITFNTLNDEGNPLTYETDLTWVKDIEISNDGLIKFIYTNLPDKDLSYKIKWIDSVTLDDHGTVTIDYNTGEQDVFSQKLRSIDNISLSDEGKFEIIYNTLDENNSYEKYTTHLTWPIDVRIEADGKVKYTFNNGTVEYGDVAIKFIEDMKINEYYKLLVKYTTEDDYVDLGYVKSYDGVLVGANYSSIQNEEGEEIDINNRVAVLGWLNNSYPNGREDGKIVVFGLDADNKEYYAYNYDTKTWFYLGNMESGTSMIVADLLEGVDINDESGMSADTIAIRNSLPVGGYWFINTVPAPNN